MCAGGRANNGEGVGPSGSGVVGVGVRTLNEAGTVADWSREQVELFCISKLINCVLEPDEEFVFLDFHFAMRTYPSPPHSLGLTAPFLHIIPLRHWTLSIAITPQALHALQLHNPSSTGPYHCKGSLYVVTKKSNLQW